ncbi:MAG: hypothetical protein EOP09_01235, partial [Proteobacteria bacterium]
LDWPTNLRKRGRYSASTIHLLSSILFCPHCGARMVGQVRSKSDGCEFPMRYVCPRRISNRELHQNGMTMVNATSLEDAVLRVLRAVLVMPPAPVAAQPTRKKVTDIDAVQAKIDRLINLHLDNKIGDSDFNRIYAELRAETERIGTMDQIDVLPEHHAQAMELAGKQELSREELRQLVLLMVEKVEAPIVMEGVTIRVDRKTLRRLAKITLRFPTAEGDAVFLAAIYENDFKGVRRFVRFRDGQPDSLRSLIGERPSQRPSLDMR